MLFNSIEFAIFLPLVFALYWFATGRHLRRQNMLLLVASYVFYGWWDWRFLTLICASSFVDYRVGISLEETPRDNERRRRLLLGASLVFNLGMLAIFKYYNFFIDNLSVAFSFFGHPINPHRLDWILPVGISFYTFQTLSYSIDIYRGELKASRDPLSFFAFVSFFPQLVAGPIERAQNLLPQFTRKREFDYEKGVDGLRQILWGLFKKIVVADNAALHVEQIFDNYGTLSGSTLLVGSLLFIVQIYCEFSGYSDIAIGTARLFGFKLMRNFAYPHFSRSMGEFWRRWHISLSTWFRDYLYIPLGGSRGGPILKARNVMIIFVVSGIWHGPDWNYISWGAICGLSFLPAVLRGANRQHQGGIAEGRILPTPLEILEMLRTTMVVIVAWTFFRSHTLGAAVIHLRTICSASLFTLPSIYPETLVTVQILACFLMEWFHREKQHGLQLNTTLIPRPMRWVLYYLIVGMIFMLGGREQEFVYFQF